MISLNTSKVLATIEEGVGWLTLNNPRRHNAISLEMWQGIGEALEAFDTAPDVRVAVMRGAGGKAFASGADLSEFDQHRSNAQQRESYGEVSKQGRRWLARFEKPLIAMIEGYCMGGGLVVALSADIRFATPGSTLGIPAARLGLGYEYQGAAQLARLVGPSVARDILFTGRKIAADEAHQMGLINFVASADEIESRTRAYADLIAANAPLTVRAAKAALNAFERYSQLEARKAVAPLVDACFDSQDYREGRRAFAEKRAPRFEGR